MKDFLIRLSILCTLVLAIATVINDAIGKKNREPAHYKLQYQELLDSKVPSKYLILGSSHATHGVRPSLLDLPNMSGYNFALNGSNPEFYVNWYRQLFKPNYPKPKLIIFCIDWFLFDEQWLWRQYEQDSQYFPTSTFIKNLIDYQQFDTKTLLLNRFPFTKHKSVVDLAHLGNNAEDSIFPVSEFDRGFIPYEQFTPNSVNPKTENISKKQQKLFESLIDAWAKENIKIIFVNIPEYGPLQNYQSLTVFDYFDKIAEQYAIPVLNYNIDKRSDINDTREYFSDWGHLNGIGSQVFSKQLGQDLQPLLQALSE